MNDNPLVMVVGMCGAGKSAVTAHFHEKGWQLVRFGEITIRELASRGLDVSEANERAIREELRELHGPDAYAKMLLPSIRKALKSGPTVIDGLYSWAEYKFLKRNVNSRMHVVAVFVPRQVRYERLSRRRVRPLMPSEAEARDTSEIENIEKGGPIAMADFTICNDKSEADLAAEVNALLLTEILKEAE